MLGLPCKVDGPCKAFSRPIIAHCSDGGACLSTELADHNEAEITKKMILGEDPKHVSPLNVNLSLILSLCLSPILSLSPSPDLSLCVSLRRSWSWYWSWSWFSCSSIVCCSLSLSIWGHLGASGSIWEHLGASESTWEHLGASGSIWEHLGASGSHLGVIWESSGGPEAASGSHLEANIGNSSFS